MLSDAIQQLTNACVQMHGCGEYTPEDVDELELAAWKVIKACEPVKVKKYTKKILIDDSGDEAVVGEEVFFDCGKCGKRLSRSSINNGIQYCWHCGQAVDWDVL